MKVNMLIYMKMTRHGIEALASRIDRKRLEKGLKYADLARASGVHPSQTQRICQAKFQTFGGNLVRICSTLGIDLNDLDNDNLANDPHWMELQHIVRTVWDGTPDGANAIASLIRAAVAIRKPDATE